MFFLHPLSTIPYSYLEVLFELTMYSSLISHK